MGNVQKTFFKFTRSEFMVKGELRVRIPNPHRGDIGKTLLRQIRLNGTLQGVLRKAPMRILMMCYEFPPIGGGGGGFVDGLCRELARHGDIVNLMTMRFKALPHTEKVDGFTIHRIPCVRLKEYHCSMTEVATYQASGFWHGIRLVRALQPDLIHANFIFPDGLLAWWTSFFSKTPFIITAHGTDVPDYNPHRAIKAHCLFLPIWKQITRYARVVVCPSHKIRELVEAHSPESNTKVIPNGSDTERFRKVQKKKRIIAVTRLLERKGVQYLIQAVKDMDLDWEVVIAGDGPFLGELKQLASSSNVQIKFTGWLDNKSDELRKLYESSSIFVLPSESENFPICLLEAMASRNAIITSQGTGCEEVVGGTGKLVQPKDAVSIRKAIVELTKSDELRVKLGDLAYERVTQKFSWPVVSEQYRALYRKYSIDK